MECDQGLIKQVFANFISNALKYTHFRDNAVIEIGESTNGEESAIFIRDNGAGFDMKHVDKLFGAFQRLHREEEFEGNGVGLATVRRIVQRHGGRIWAEAELDKGATFYFTLASRNSTLAATNRMTVLAFLKKCSRSGIPGNRRLPAKRLFKNR